MALASSSLDRPQYPPLSHACLAVVLFACALLLAFVDKQVMALLVEPLKNSLLISDTQIGLLQGLAFSLFSAVAGLPLGRLVDQVNRIRLLIACILIWSLMTMLCSVAGGFVQLFALRVGVGIGEACIYPLLYSIIADLFPRRTRATAMVLFYLVCTVGTNLALAVAGSVIGMLAKAGSHSLLGNTPYWRATYLVLGAPGPLLALLIALLVREPTRKETGRTPGGADIRAVIGHVWRHRVAFLALIAGWASVVAAANAIIAWYPSVMVRHFGLTAPQAGIRYGVFVAAAAVIAVPISAFIERHVHPEKLPKVLLFGLLSSLVAVFTFPWASSANMGLSLIVIQYIGYMWIVGLTPVLLQDISPNEFRGQIFAIAALCSTILQGLTPVAVGFLSDRVLTGEHALAVSIMLTIAPLLGIIVCFYLPLQTAFARARAEMSAYNTDAAETALAPLSPNGAKVLS